MMMRQLLYFAFEEGAPTNPIGSADEVSADPWSTNSSTAVSLLISKTLLPPKIDRKNLLSPITIHQVCCQQLCPHLFPLVLTSLTIKLILLLIESTMIDSIMIEFLLIYLQRQIPVTKGLPRTYSFSTKPTDVYGCARLPPTNRAPLWKKKELLFVTSRMNMRVMWPTGRQNIYFLRCDLLCKTK